MTNYSVDLVNLDYIIMVILVRRTVDGSIDQFKTEDQISTVKM